MTRMFDTGEVDEIGSITDKLLVVDSSITDLNVKIAALVAQEASDISEVKASIAALEANLLALIAALDARVTALELVDHVVRYNHVQVIALDTWPITHRLGKYPASIHLTDDVGVPFGAQAVEATNDQVVIYLGASYSGKASLLF